MPHRCPTCQERELDTLATLPYVRGFLIAYQIGTKKFIYDIWGDAVNTAARLESHGVPGRIHVSDTVFERLQGRFAFEERGLTELKGRGPMNTYFLEAPIQ